MLLSIFRRFMSDVPALGNDLNKKILEAFNSIIDKGAKTSVAKKDPIIQPISRYNVDSRSSIVKIQDYKAKLSDDLKYDPIVIKNPPDIFKRNKLSPQFLHKVNIKKFTLTAHQLFENIYLMSKVLSPSGSILSKSLTSTQIFASILYYLLFLFVELSSKTHRHMSKVIRRARQMGNFKTIQFLYN